MKKYMKILKNDNSQLNLGRDVVKIGTLYSVNTHYYSPTCYEIAIPGLTDRWAIAKEQEGEYYVIVGEHQAIPLIGV